MASSLFRNIPENRSLNRKNGASPDTKNLSFIAAFHFCFGRKVRARNYKKFFSTALGRDRAIFLFRSEGLATNK